MPNLEDVGANAPKGEPGKGSPNPYRFELLAPMAMAALAKLRAQAAEVHGDWTWRSAGADVHFSKALTHMFAYMAGDRTESSGRPEEHLIHSLCRLMFAVDIQECERINKCDWHTPLDEIVKTFTVNMDNRVDAAIEYAKACGNIREGPFNKPPFGHDVIDGQADIARYPEHNLEIVVTSDGAKINGMPVTMQIAKEMQRCMEKASRSVRSS